MKIIGLNSGYDAANNNIYSGGVAYICDGKIEIALAEDRISRKKNDGGFNTVLPYIYREYDINKDDIDLFCISFYGQPILPDKTVIEQHLKFLDIEEHPEKLLVLPSHHYSHALLAHILSPFEQSIIMVADNEGNLLTPKDAKEKVIMYNHCERNSYFWAHGNCLTLIDRDFGDFGDVSFGKMYNKFNEYIGFGSYLNAGKTMGLSSYGHVPDEWKNLDLWYMDDSGHLHSNIKETHDSFDDIEYFFKRHGIFLTRGMDYNSIEYQNLACFVQEQLNKWSKAKIKYLSNKFGISNICISGGVGLNSIMNYTIDQLKDLHVFVPPYCSDPGQALGNAIYGYIYLSGLNRNTVLPKVVFDKYVYLGTEYTEDRINKELQLYDNDSRVKIRHSDSCLAEAAKYIAEKKIVAFYNGRSEYGARALGNRSILALPTSVEIRDRINTLKGRELFRPLAPAVLDRFRNDYFESELSILDIMMLRVVPVKEDKKDIICGVTHVDGTSRLQVVTKENNFAFYSLIEEVYKRTGIPVVINTSFNSAGESIVESVHDAVESFLNMRLDVLVCGNYIITRN